MRSPLSTVPAGIIVPAFPQRSPPSLLTTAACGGLGSVPDDRTRKGPPSSLVQLRAAATLATLVTHDPQRASGAFVKYLLLPQGGTVEKVSAIDAPGTNSVRYTRDDFRLIVVTERNKDEATIHGQERPRRIYGSREDVLIWAMLLKCAPRTRK